MVHTYNHNSVRGDYNSKIDIWGAVGDTFSLSLGLYNYSSSGSHIHRMSIPFVSSAVDTTINVDFVSSRDSVYHCNIVVTHDNPNNHRPSILVNFYKTGAPNPYDIFRFTFKSTSADVHMWSDDEQFYKAGSSRALDGDNEYSIGGKGANGNDVISVGSYATRTKLYGADGSFRNLESDVEGDLSYFSSHGPTLDGRVKPDICAPGQYLNSSANATAITENNLGVDSIFFNGSMHYYALMQGTSMSSPAAAGIIAIWLQHNPSLNVDSVRRLLHNSGISDRFTGSLPAEGSNEWGWGKIDAFTGLPTPSALLHYVYAYPYVPSTGHATGRGRHPEGQHTIEAIPTQGFAFDHWNNTREDITGNPFTFNLESDTIFLARFWEIPCDTVSQFPWEPVFTEGSLICWENYSPGTAPVTWALVQGKMISVGVPAAGGPDAMLVTPPVRAQANTGLFYNVTSSSQEPSFDSLTIVVFNAEDEIVGLYPERLNSDNGGDFVVSLDPYAGQVVKFGFYHHACIEMSLVTLASVKIDHYVGIEEIEKSKLKIETSGLNIRIDNLDGETVSLYDITGRQLVTSHLSSFTFLLPAAGVYVVKAGNLPAHKVVVVR